MLTYPRESTAKPKMALNYNKVPPHNKIAKCSTPFHRERQALSWPIKIRTISIKIHRIRKTIVCSSMFIKENSPFVMIEWRGRTEDGRTGSTRTARQLVPPNSTAAVSRIWLEFHNIPLKNTINFYSTMFTPDPWVRNVVTATFHCAVRWQSVPHESTISSESRTCSDIVT